MPQRNKNDRDTGRWLRRLERWIGTIRALQVPGLALAVLGSAFLGTAVPALAHFQEIIPATPVITEAEERRLTLALTFTHPMEGGPVMPMERPQRAGVLVNGTVTDLTDALRPVTRQGRPAWNLSYTLRRPGDHVFFVEPAPYWEPAEEKMIVHYAKVVVNAYGAEDGWDARVGLPVEIAPLTRPYGLWTGNVFQGVVLKAGTPVPHAMVEVEYRSEGTIKPPASPYVTQVVKADADGVFTYAMPRAGWWGFAALLDGEKPVPGPDGVPVTVEEGGLLWVHVRDMR